jgi:hypothetical protein
MNQGATPPLEISSRIVAGGVLLVCFAGAYPSGSLGNPVAEWMLETGKLLAREQQAKAIIVDLSQLTYECGDMIEWVYGIGSECEPPLRQATIVSDRNRRALSTLEWGGDTKQDITELDEVFDSVDEAVAFVGRSGD